MAIRLLCLMSLVLMAESQKPQLDGAHLRITAVEEHGFLNIIPGENGTLSYSGYLIDILKGLSERANFTYDLFPPSGLGSQCNPRIIVDNNGDNVNITSRLYDDVYRTQYNCGANDVIERYDALPPTDIYLGMYYVTPERQLSNQFTISLSPPFGGLAMLGTATHIPNFTSLERRSTTHDVKVCAPEGTASLDFVRSSYPGLQVDGLLVSTEENIWSALRDGVCQVYIVDEPLAAQFVSRQSQEGRCVANNGMPLGLIGEPMKFGFSQYAIGIRSDLPVELERTLSYWLNVMMTCNPADEDGSCPEGNLATFYEDYVGSGDECGYVLYPSDPPKPNTALIIGVILGTVAFLGIFGWAWLRYRLRRQARLYAKRARVAMEQASREREFTDVLAHEIRNPLASAIAALHFVSAKADDPAVVPLIENRTTMRSDITVIDSSLQFVNDLLRNMLDLHRSASRQLTMDFAPTDVLRDIFEPVSSILFMRGTDVKILVDCPKNLTIKADRMRLKQIVLNLAANSTKFVEKGYIKLRASTVEGNVHIFIEDSGPGIPEVKRITLFAKFQESLDSLNQGTGIGLSVCKNLSEIMGAELFLDESFNSGFPSCPGTRFTLRMNTSPLQLDDVAALRSDEIPELQSSLPLELSVLFVDDDTIVRKLFARTIQRVAPTWKIQEASNGETALRLADKERFDIMFIDQYMASVEKQLLGTETVRLLRAKGVASVICGISANDKAQEFEDAGADGFIFKPFPCKNEALKIELSLLLSKQTHSNTFRGKEVLAI